MSNIKAKRVQIGISAPASPHPNFTIFQPDTPDGTMRIRNADAGDAGTDLFTFLGAAAPDLEIDGRKIAEYGSNANGEYVRYYNGVQVCWRYIARASESISIASAGGYRSTGFAYLYAAAFVSQPKVFASSNLATAWAIGYHQDLSNFGIVWYRVDSATANVEANLMSIGRWY